VIRGLLTWVSHALSLSSLVFWKRQKMRVRKKTIVQPDNMKPNTAQLCSRLEVRERIS
jgi:hypothetical protein